MDAIAQYDLAEHARHVYDGSDFTQATIDGLVDLIGSATGIDLADGRERLRVETLIRASQLVPGFDYSAADVAELAAIAERPVPADLDGADAESYRTAQRDLVERVAARAGSAPSAAGRTIANVLKSLVARKY